jgi:hypothetical protein
MISIKLSFPPEKLSGMGKRTFPAQFVCLGDIGDGMPTDGGFPA